MMNALKAGAARDGEHDDATNTTKTLFMNVMSSSPRRRHLYRRLAVGMFAVAALAGAAACTTTKAAAPIEHPALDVPPPPPRVVVPLPPPQPQLEPVESLGSDALPAPPRPRPAPKETQKPEQKPEDPKPPEPTPPPAQAPPPPPVLRMPETTSSAQLAKQIQDSIARSKAILEKVDYRRLSSVGVKAYEESKLFAQEAEDALKENNLAYAKELADKAERLAKGLQGR
jgi:outer membrane biosynthesis protein TonB